MAVTEVFQPSVALAGTAHRQTPLNLRRCLPRSRWIVLLLVAGVTGCSGKSGPPRYDISGHVTYNGKPVAVGQIQFEPDASRGNRGPAGAARIEDGSYNTAKAGRGHVGGPHRVLIVGYDGVADPNSELPHGRPLFDPYRTAVDLPRETSTRDFQVPAHPER